MPHEELDFEQLTKTLAENFNILADEVQFLSDRRTILEHKLRFAHEQYQQLADKYARSDPEILSTISKLQIPADTYTAPERVGFVPLPQRQRPSSKHQTAVAIRDGRKASKLLAALTYQTTESTGSIKTVSRSSSNARLSLAKTSLSTVLEQDFTIPGKKGSLSCPFAHMPTVLNDASLAATGSTNSHKPSISSPLREHAVHDPSDPICAALYAETMPSPTPSVTASAMATKCPIRFLDHHSPEEVAKYFETHKHEIPRSHEICVKRYQRNEEDIIKLDAKYGNLVSMIQGLGQKHQSMLPTKEEEEAVDVERSSNERVQNWAKGISVDGTDHEETASVQNEDDRSSRFDRPLKEVRVGESPSRPWGISVPVLERPMEQRAASPPPAPVPKTTDPSNMTTPSGKCPFGHGGPKGPTEEKPSPGTFAAETTPRPNTYSFSDRKPAVSFDFKPDDDSKQDEDHRQSESFDGGPPKQPAFIPAPDFTRTGNSQVPQMIFTGPVFVGYSFEQAMAFLQQYQQRQ